jgi:hypothetical protein
MNETAKHQFLNYREQGGSGLSDECWSVVLGPFQKTIGLLGSTKKRKQRSSLETELKNAINSPRVL